MVDQDLGWKVETQYATYTDDQYTDHIVEINGVEQVVGLFYGPVTSQQIDCFVAYGFFDTEKEAAQAFLQGIKEHPDARYRKWQYDDAQKAVSE